MSKPIFILPPEECIAGSLINISHVVMLSISKIEDLSAVCFWKNGFESVDSWTFKSEDEAQRCVDAILQESTFVAIRLPRKVTYKRAERRLTLASEKTNDAVKDQKRPRKSKKKGVPPVSAGVTDKASNETKAD